MASDRPPDDKQLRQAVTLPEARDSRKAGISVRLAIFVASRKVPAAIASCPPVSRQSEIGQKCRGPSALPKNPKSGLRSYRRARLMWPYDRLGLFNSAHAQTAEFAADQSDSGRTESRCVSTGRATLLWRSLGLQVVGAAATRRQFHAAHSSAYRGTVKANGSAVSVGMPSAATSRAMDRTNMLAA